MTNKCHCVTYCQNIVFNSYKNTNCFRWRIQYKWM